VAVYIGAGDMKQPEPRVLILDIESSLDILASYGLKEQYHRPENILQDWYVICFSWKWLGGSRIYDYSIIEDMKRFRKADDYHVIKRMHEVISDCEVMVGHNVDRFDWKKFMARVIYNGLPPLDKPFMVDTLKEARNIAAFTSNSMKYLSKHLKVNGKQMIFGADQKQPAFMLFDKRLEFSGIHFNFGEL